MAEWVEVIVPVGAGDVDDVAALITAEIPLAAAGTQQRGDEVVFWVSDDAAASALVQTRDAVTRWQAGGAKIDPARVRIATAVPEAEWRDAWKRYFKVSRITRQFVVVPSWESYQPGADDIVIDLDPAMAFGTGTHASTQLVLEELQRLADRQIVVARMLDVGCGSGILAIAALKRWPGARCVAIDNDPIATATTIENATHNRVAERISATTTPLDDVAGTFDLVVANIQAHVLRELMAGLVAATAPSGTLVLSGLLSAQARPLADEFIAAGMREVGLYQSQRDAEWSSVVLTR